MCVNACLLCFLPWLLGCLLVLLGVPVSNERGGWKSVCEKTRGDDTTSRTSCAARTHASTRTRGHARRKGCRRTLTCNMGDNNSCSFVLGFVLGASLRHAYIRHMRCVRHACLCASSLSGFALPTPARRCVPWVGDVAAKGAERTDERRPLGS